MPPALSKPYVSKLAKHKVNDAVSTARAIIFGGLPINEKLNSGISLYLDVDLFLGGIDSGDVGNALEGLRRLLVFWSKSLAVAAPGSVKLHQPNAFASLFEIRCSKASNRREAVVEGATADGKSQ